MRKVMNKRGEFLQKYLIEVIIVAVIILMFFMATAEKSDSRGVKQQVLEKQIALLVEAGSPGMVFYLDKVNINGYVNRVRFERGRVFVDVEGLISSGGYPYFSRYDVSVRELNDQFLIEVNE